MTTQTIPKRNTHPLTPQIEAIVKSEGNIKDKVALLKEDLPSLEKEGADHKLLQMRQAIKTLKMQARKPEELESLFFLAQEIELRLNYPDF